MPRTPHLQEMPKEFQPHVPDTPQLGRLQHEATVKVQEYVSQREHGRAEVLPRRVNKLEEGVTVRGLALQGLHLAAHVGATLGPQSAIPKHRIAIVIDDSMRYRVWQ